MSKLPLCVLCKDPIYSTHVTKGLLQKGLSHNVCHPNPDTGNHKVGQYSEDVYQLELKNKKARGSKLTYRTQPQGTNIYK